MRVVAVFSGPAHVLVDTNEAARTILPVGAFGLPVREAFPQSRYAALVATMDRVFEEGGCSTVNLPNGRPVTVCRWERGQDRGVGTTADLPQPQSQQQLLAREWSEPVGAPRGVA